jgi:diguanylate cyclase (GGDEF)-like protein
VGKAPASGSTDVRSFVYGQPVGLIGDHAAPRRVLVIEDSTTYAVLTEQMLKDALGPQTAIEIADSLAIADVRIRSNTPDCILLDLSLPDAKGVEAVGAVQAMAPEVPIIVLSGHDDDALSVQAVQSGAQDYLVKQHANPQLLARSIRYAIERKRTEQEIARQAFVDPLTNLPNRIRLIESLTTALARVERYGERVAVLFIDLDRFKIINDSLGHGVGDHVLRVVAERLASSVRPTDTVARFGGDEFVVLCERVANDDDVSALADRIGHALAEGIETADGQLTVGASIGIAIGDGRGIGPEALIRAADQAMFRAKQRGTGSEIAEGTGGRASSKRLDIQAELRRALERAEFRLHYQPQVDFAAGGVDAVEALLRWEHPHRGLVAPSEFIPEAEASGLIVMIGEWVIQESCRQLATWRAAGTCGADLVMSVNLSSRQLADARLVGVVRQSLEHNAIEPEHLCLEISESTVDADPNLAGRTLKAIKDLGALLALDDFGTGNSSLATLDTYPVDVLKVDRSFLAPARQGPRRQRFLTAVVGVARALGLSVVAEGIESAEQLRIAETVGCDAGQGFWLAKPAPAVSVAGALLLPNAASAA